MGRLEGGLGKEVDMTRFGGRRSVVFENGWAMGLVIGSRKTLERW